MSSSTLVLNLVGRWQKRFRGYMKKIAIIGLLTLTLLISGCTGLKPVETVTEAFESGNASQCESIKDVNIRGTCYAGAAVSLLFLFI